MNQYSSLLLQYYLYDKLVFLFLLLSSSLYKWVFSSFIIIHRNWSSPSLIINNVIHTIIFSSLLFSFIIPLCINYLLTEWFFPLFLSSIFLTVCWCCCCCWYYYCYFNLIIGSKLGSTFWSIMVSAFELVLGPISESSFESVLESTSEPAFN